MSFHKNISDVSRSLFVHRGQMDLAKSINGVPQGTPQLAFTTYRNRGKFNILSAWFHFDYYTGVFNISGSFQLKCSKSSTSFTSPNVLFYVGAYGFLSGTTGSADEVEAGFFTDTLQLLDPGTQFWVRNEGSSNMSTGVCMITLFVKGYYLDI